MTQEEQIGMSQVQLEIMDEIHRVCEKFHITYFMICGTLLGAVRHGGYIPWDIDIDIAMPRKAYERFKEVCSAELDEKYTYMDFCSEPNYDWPHAVVSKKNTRVCLKYDQLNRRRQDRGIYLDIFPLDNAPDDQKLRDKQAKSLLRLRKFKHYRIPYVYSNKAWKRYAHYVISFLLSWIPIKTINRIQQDLMKKYDLVETTHICSMASQYSYYKQCMPWKIYGDPVRLSFEGRMYYAPAKYEEYLTRIYGDYMKLPPVEKRQKNLEAITSVQFDVNQQMK